VQPSTYEGTWETPHPIILREKWKIINHLSLPLDPPLFSSQKKRRKGKENPNGKVLGSGGGEKRSLNFVLPSAVDEGCWSSPRGRPARHHR